MAPFIDLIFFAKTADDLVAKDKLNSAFFLWTDDWVKYDQIASAGPAISMATIGSGDSRYLVAKGPEGDFWELENGSRPTYLGESAATISTRERWPRWIRISTRSAWIAWCLEGRQEPMAIHGPRQATEAEGIIGF
ncbi:MAG: hypothetical protein MZV65_48075 [Chromatiales bacterium]|nr:hypothetical protein [Chromatiales bacterium]